MDGWLQKIFYTHLIQFRVTGELEPIPAVIGREAGYILDRLPVHHRATERQTRRTTMHHTLSPMDNLETPINLICMFLEEAGVPRENPCIHREDMQTPHRKAQARNGTRCPLAVRRQCRPPRGHHT